MYTNFKKNVEYETSPSVESLYIYWLIKYEKNNKTSTRFERDATKLFGYTAANIHVKSILFFC